MNKHPSAQRRTLEATEVELRQLLKTIRERSEKGGIGFSAEVKSKDDARAHCRHSL